MEPEARAPELATRDRRGRLGGWVVAGVALLALSFAVGLFLVTVDGSRATWLAYAGLAVLVAIVGALAWAAARRRGAHDAREGGAR